MDLKSKSHLLYRSANLTLNFHVVRPCVIVRVSPLTECVERTDCIVSIQHSSGWTFCCRVLNVTLLQDVTNQTFSEADKFATLTAMSEDVTGCTALFNFLNENWKILKKRSVNFSIPRSFFVTLWKTKALLEDFDWRLNYYDRSFHELQ